MRLGGGPLGHEQLVRRRPEWVQLAPDHDLVGATLAGGLADRRAEIRRGGEDRGGWGALPPLAAGIEGAGAGEPWVREDPNEGGGTAEGPPHPWRPGPRHRHPPPPP